jgi:hypothetical protein
MRFPHPFEGVRPPTDDWVDRPEVYNRKVELTGTNRPNTCQPNPQHKQQTTPTRATGPRTHPTRTVEASRPQSTPTPHAHPCTKGGSQRGHRVTAATATGKHPAPSRTRKLSLPAPMVLQPQGCGRVGRRRTTFRRGHPVRGGLYAIFSMHRGSDRRCARRERRDIGSR